VCHLCHATVGGGNSIYLSNNRPVPHPLGSRNPRNVDDFCVIHVSIANRWRGTANQAETKISFFREYYCLEIVAPPHFFGVDGNVELLG